MPNTCPSQSSARLPCLAWAADALDVDQDCDAAPGLLGDLGRVGRLAARPHVMTHARPIIFFMSIRRPANAAMFVPHLALGPEVKAKGAPYEIPLPGFTAPEGMNEISEFTIDVLPWMSPSVVAVVGGPGRAEDGGEQILVCYEWPIPYFVAHRALEKNELEFLHISRCEADLRSVSSKQSFAVAGRGAEPPDFLVDLSDGHQVGLECTVLADSKRRAVEGLFSRIRSRLMKEPLHRWKRIAGYVIVAWFVGEDKLLPDQLPHKKSDEEAIEALVDRLGRFEPGTTGDPLGQPSDYSRALRNMGVVSSGFGCLFYALPMHEAVPATDFFTHTGFELACLYESLHTATSIVGEIDRLVHQHDKKGVDWLLITASGPRRDGLIHPSEMTLANSLVRTKVPLASPRHIRRILLHFFPVGGVYELFPNRRWWASPQYSGGLMVAHHRRNAPEQPRLTLNPRQ